jgi:hypothetical protein
MKLHVELNALTSVPVFEKHQRGKNWLAEIKLDPKSPGGIARRFFPRCRGDYYYEIRSLAGRMAPVEFGADYYTSSGKKVPKRAYGVLKWDGGEEAEFIQTETARQAIELYDKMRSTEE